MKQTNTDVEEIDESELPVSGVVRVQRRTGYGSVADLDDEAPADIGELQRIIAYEMYGPVIDLPGRGGRLGHVVLDANGEVDWDAIGPAGGRRRRAEPAPSGRAGELRAELARVIGLIGLVNERVGDGVEQRRHDLDPAFAEGAAALGRDPHDADGQRFGQVFGLFPDAGQVLVFRAPPDHEPVMLAQSRAFTQIDAAGAVDAADGVYAPGLEPGQFRVVSIQPIREHDILGLKVREQPPEERQFADVQPVDEQFQQGPAAPAEHRQQPRHGEAAPGGLRGGLWKDGLQFRRVWHADAAAVNHPYAMPMPAPVGLGEFVRQILSQTFEQGQRQPLAGLRIRAGIVRRT